MNYKGRLGVGRLTGIGPLVSQSGRYESSSLCQETISRVPGKLAEMADKTAESENETLLILYDAPDFGRGSSDVMGDFEVPLPGEDGDAIPDNEQIVVGNYSKFGIPPDVGAIVKLHSHPSGFAYASAADILQMADDVSKHRSEGHCIMGGTHLARWDKGSFTPELQKLYPQYEVELVCYRKKRTIGPDEYEHLMKRLTAKSPDDMANASVTEQVQAAQDMEPIILEYYDKCVVDFSIENLRKIS